MPITPARAAAFDILLRVEQEDAYSSELLHSPQYSKLSHADHGLATELVMGVLRWRSLLDANIANVSSQSLQKLDPEVLTALRLAAYQLAFLNRIPERAAVHESVELVKRARKRSAVPFANAVLRKLAQNKGDSKISKQNLGSAADFAATFAHPTWLVERWVKQFGVETVRAICEYDQKIPETSIRISDASIEEELKQEKVALESGWLLTSARRVISGDITRTQSFREGRVHIQDEASQLVALLVGEGTSILDCCAAPGGKTRMLAERNPEAAVLAAELHPHRARLLKKLVPAENLRVISTDIRALPFNMQFDRVLADVPCSGTGTLARNPEIKWRLKAEDLSELQTWQVAILKSAMTQVKPGGRLVYSSCSLEREENSDVVEKAMASDLSFRIVDCRAELERLKTQGELALQDFDSLVSEPYLRTIPGIHHCDGFFAAILEKK
ncbi:MAG TPA: 16S rRNA (cytosine(967)-C(5))-methyltransferase RsmB [Terriglobales bacterium]|nr:16S rRNA (cytosine(967)-C(5))-methyltransferase RsmB [Terriglobales bacterium]